MGATQIVAIVVSIVSFSMGYIVAAEERKELGKEIIAFLDQRFRVSVGVTALILFIGSLVYLGLSRWWLPFVVFFAAVALSFVIQKLVLLLVIAPMHWIYSRLTGKGDN